MEIDSSELIKKLERLKKNLNVNIPEAIGNVTLSMHEDIVSASAITFSPSWQAAVTMFGKHYFTESYDSQRTDGKTNGILETIQKENLTLNKVAGEFTVGLGDVNLLDAEAPYWRIFLGYGQYNRRIGQRAGGSLDHAFVPYRTDNGSIIENAGFMSPTDEEGHPGVMPVFMFEDTLDHYRPIIQAKIQSAIRKSIPK